MSRLRTSVASHQLIFRFNANTTKEDDKQKLVRDGIEVRAQRGLLVQRARENAVQPIGQPGNDQDRERQAVPAVVDGDNKKRQKSKPQKRELVRDGEDARGHFLDFVSAHTNSAR